MALTRKQFFAATGNRGDSSEGECLFDLFPSTFGSGKDCRIESFAIDDGMVCFDGKLDDLSDRFENLEEFYKNLYGADKK